MLLTTLLGAILVLSCRKDDNDYFSYDFPADGSIILYDGVDIDGATLSIESEGTHSRPAFFGVDGDYDKSDWFVELDDWTHVFYTPATKVLTVSANKNDTGRKRNARLTADKNGKGKLVVDIRQGY